MAGSSNFTLHTSDGLPAGLPVQTKPNLGELEYLGNGLDGLVQTNPIWRDARWGLPPRAWRAPVVQTNPIPPVATGLAVQTNPIRGQPDGRRGSIMRQRLVARCRSGNKAKLGKAGASGGQPYKQSQFPGGAGRPSSPLDPPASPPPSQLRKTNPICPVEPGGTGPAGRGPWGKCAKRTQFRQSAWTLDDEVCKTNPISGSQPDPGVGCTNKANSLRTDRDGRWPAGLDVLCRGGTIVRNKPNCSRAISTLSTSWERAYDKLGREMASAKQSQFPPAGPAPAGHARKGGATRNIETRRAINGNLTCAFVGGPDESRAAKWCSWV
jgi:hypothetical protein